MARLFPTIEPSEIENSGERKMAEALLEQLPVEVEVFHSFNWLGSTSKGVIVEGECDFVIIDPANGVLFVEVKGGTLDYDPRLSKWVRKKGGEAPELLNKDPFAQANASMHELMKGIRKKFSEKKDAGLPFSYGYAVAFPECRYTGTLPPSIVPDLILDATKCQDIRTSLSAVFERFRHGNPSELTPRNVQSIHDALLPEYSLVPVTWRKVEEQEERMYRLTNDQQNLLTFMSKQSQAAIQGGAGSGKTILGLAKAQECVRNGLRTLFLCFNRPLADWLNQAAPVDTKDMLVINNYHGLADEYCKRAELPLFKNFDSNDADFWENKVPEGLISACEILGDEHKFDAIIVDEGQDFRELWWTSLEDVFRTPASKQCYYVFFDPNQNIYVETPFIPEEFGEPFELSVNCRNTVRIAEHCAALVGGETKARHGAPLGDEPEIKNARTIADGFRKAGKQVRTWCMANAGGLKMSQVAVLTPGDIKAQWPSDFRAIAITEDFDEWRQNKGVLISSWGRFKGLEADAIIILEPTSLSKDISDTNRYVAHSRAKHLLVVIQVHDE